MPTTATARHHHTKAGRALVAAALASLVVVVGACAKRQATAPDTKPTQSGVAAFVSDPPRAPSPTRWPGLGPGEAQAMSGEPVTFTIVGGEVTILAALLEQVDLAAPQNGLLPGSYLFTQLQVRNSGSEAVRISPGDFRLATEGREITPLGWFASTANLTADPRTVDPGAILAMTAVFDEARLPQPAWLVLTLESRGVRAIWQLA